MTDVFLPLPLSTVCLCLSTELKRQLEQKQDEVIFKTAEIEKVFANPRISKHIDSIRCDHLVTV